MKVETLEKKKKKKEKGKKGNCATVKNRKSLFDVHYA